MKSAFFLVALLASAVHPALSQALRLPGNSNYTCMTGRKLGVTDIEIRYNAPAVKGREGNIYGTGVVPFGYEVLGYGSDVPSPWRAGADECTTLSFSTDVFINGKKLPAGKYAFFIEVHPDTSILIFNKNAEAWGSYFYRKELDVLRVPTLTKKNQPVMQERLLYHFTDQTDHTVQINLDWERWSFPIKVEVDLKNTVLEDIRRQMSGAIGFDPASLEAAARWCVQNDTNYTQALNWINAAVNPQLGGLQTFNALSTKAQILQKLGKDSEAGALMKTALEKASVTEMHGYGRQLLAQQKLQEAMEVFQANFTRHKGAWPTHAGLMRAWSAMGNYTKALEHARAALAQAPDEPNKRFLADAIRTLEAGKPVK